MSPYILSVLLGIVEGLTEFLPVSSTAHLRIAEALMKIPLGESSCAVGNAACLQDVAYWKMYTIVIQVGAIMALCLLFLERIVNFLRTFPDGENGDRNLAHPPHLAHAHRFCLHLRPRAAAAQMERKEPGQPQCHGHRAARGRHRDVGR